MCGITGIISLSDKLEDPEALRRMTEVLNHRGPDDLGYVTYSKKHGLRNYLSDNDIRDKSSDVFNIGMGFRRLSILDLSFNGHQPMLNGGKNVVVTLNGEIYNYRELRDILKMKGYFFKSNSDTEVLLYMYEEYGLEDTLCQLNGMFAFAIFDITQNSFYVVRDRLGIKPLYYYYDNKVFLYTSEVKAILTYDRKLAQLNNEILSEYLMFRYISEPNTLFKNIFTLRPGNYLQICNGEVKNKSYWEIPKYNPSLKSIKDCEDEIENKLCSSINYRLISDVKVGTQLSGGIDSSLITLYAAKLQRTTTIDAVSVIFDNKEFSEEKYIDTVASKTKIHVHKVSLTADYFVTNLEKTTWHQDFPLNHENSIGVYLLSSLAKNYVTVLLSGEGADELFGGYQRYARLIQLTNRNLASNFLTKLSQDYIKKCNNSLVSKILKYENLQDWLINLSSFGSPQLISNIYKDFSMKSALRNRKALFEESKDENHIETMLSYDMRTYLVDLLNRQDKMSMAHAIENRIPFLDHRIVELTKRIPTKFKINRPLFSLHHDATYGNKYILKKMALRHFDKEFVYRKKSGFGLPLRDFFNTIKFKELWEHYRSNIRKDNVFDINAIDNLYSNALRGDSPSIKLFWIVLAFQAWHAVFIDNGCSSHNKAYHN
jgi:asparagine synthase (glutamine-hydrolysing)